MSALNTKTLIRNPVLCTVDAVLLTMLDWEIYVAMVRRPAENADPYPNALALPGGFVRPDEDDDTYATAERVLASKCGITAPYLEQLYTFSGAKRDPRLWSVSVSYFALVHHAIIAPAVQRNAVELIKLHTERPDPIPTKLKLAFDHEAIIKAACTRLRSKSQYSSMPAFLLDEKFTLPQLQRAYEVVIGTSLDKSWFRRKMRDMNFVEKVGRQTIMEGPNRPSQLWRIKDAYRDELRFIGIERMA